MFAESTMFAESISESFMSWLERESDRREGNTSDQLALRLMVAKMHDLGALSTSEYQYLNRRIESNA